MVDDGPNRVTEVTKAKQALFEEIKEHSFSRDYVGGEQ